jgi:L-arabinose isomerase
MSIKLKAALLPLYLALYDSFDPEIRSNQRSFLDGVVHSLEELGVDVLPLEICTVEPEFQREIHRAESEGVDMLITLHLAYSPSLESAHILSQTKLPLVILNTSPSYEFDATQDPDQLMYNHGIQIGRASCRERV